LWQPAFELFIIYILKLYFSEINIVVNLLLLPLLSLVNAGHLQLSVGSLFCALGSGDSLKRVADVQLATDRLHCDSGGRSQRVLIDALSMVSREQSLSGQQQQQEQGPRCDIHHSTRPVSQLALYFYRTTTTAVPLPLWKHLYYIVVVVVDVVVAAAEVS